MERTSTTYENGRVAAPARQHVSEKQELRHDKRLWQRIAFLILAGYPPLIGLCIYEGVREHTLVFAMQREPSGYYTPIGTIGPADPPDQFAREAAIYAFLQNVYDVAMSKDAQTALHHRVRAMVRARSQASGWIEQKQSDPVWGTDAMHDKGTAVDVSITDGPHELIDPQSGKATNLYDVVYTVTYIPSMGATVTRKYSARITADYHPEISDPVVLTLNPARILISEVDETPQL